MTLNSTLTAVFTPLESGWFMGQIAEMPGVVTQGETLEETKENLMDALDLFIISDKEDLISSNQTSSAGVVMEKVAIYETA